MKNEMIVKLQAWVQVHPKNIVHVSLNTPLKDSHLLLYPLKDDGTPDFHSESVFYLPISEISKQEVRDGFFKCIYKLMRNF